MTPVKDSKLLNLFFKSKYNPKYPNNANNDETRDIASWSTKPSLNNIEVKNEITGLKNISPGLAI